MLNAANPARGNVPIGVKVQPISDYRHLNTDTDTHTYIMFKSFIQIHF